MSDFWHKYQMKTAECSCDTLQASAPLVRALESAGTVLSYSPASALFGLGDRNRGVFLITRGSIRMGIDGLPELDRLFSQGALLGLPATFADSDYSLSASAVSAAEVVSVSRPKFMELMLQQPELCREATQMLTRELSFIHKAIARQKQQALHL